MSDDRHISEGLMKYKSVTQRTGTLFEAQRFQLTTWGQLVFDDYAHDIEVRVALPWVEHEGTQNEVYHDRHVVEYRMLVGEPPYQLRVRRFAGGMLAMVEGLDRSVKWLLGDEFTVRVVVNGDSIFESKGKPSNFNGERDPDQRQGD